MDREKVIRIVWGTFAVVILVLCGYFAKEWHFAEKEGSLNHNIARAISSTGNAVTLYKEKSGEMIFSDSDSLTEMRDWGQGEMIKSLSDLNRKSFRARRLAAEAMLAEGASKDRFVGGVSLLRENPNDVKLAKEIAHDPNPQVPLNVLGWMRDRYKTGDGVDALAAEIAERGDFASGDVENWIRDPEASAPAVRAALDLMDSDYEEDKFQRSLESLVSGNSVRNASNFLRLEAGLRLAEVAGPAETLRINNTRLEFPVAQSAQSQSREIIVNSRERAVLDKRVDTVLASLFDLPPPLQQSGLSLLRQADLANAWAAADRRGLTEVASIVERAVVEGYSIQTGVIEILERIVSGTRDATPLGELSHFQQYENERVSSAMDLLRALEIIEMDPGSDPRLQ